MNIPNLPTDNLYKFLALTGLFLMFSSFGYKEYWNNQHNIENAEISVGIEMMVHRMLLLQKKYDLNESEIKNIKAKENRELSKAYLDKMFSEGEKLRLNSELADISVERTKKMNWILNLSMVIGLCAMISGFYLWYMKLQRYQDVILLKKSQVSELKTEEEEEEIFEEEEEIEEVFEEKEEKTE